MGKEGRSFFRPTKAMRELLALWALAETGRMSQHHLGRTIGVSSAMAHNYMQTLLREEFVVVTGETNRTRRYVVTAKGCARLTTLAREYTRDIARMYSVVKTEIEKRLLRIYADGVQKVVVFGAAETGELIFSAAKSTPLTIVGWVDNDIAKHKYRFGDLQVCPPNTIESYSPDAVLIASSGKTDEIHRQLRHLSKKGINVVTL
jgi:DNA-binding MarR family transcriptional regulator